VTHHPLIPATAYEAMAQILPKSYFHTPAPAHGLRLEIVSFDNRPTQWDFDPTLGAIVVDRINRHPGLVIRSRERF